MWVYFGQHVVITRSGNWWGILLFLNGLLIYAVALLPLGLEWGQSQYRYDSKWPDGISTLMGQDGRPNASKTNNQDPFVGSGFSVDLSLKHKLATSATEECCVVFVGELNREMSYV